MVSSIGSHLVDIRPLHAPDIADVVISRRGSRVLSQYRDNVWDLAPYLPVKNLRQSTIRFDIALPDGSVLTDPQHAPLLAAAKRFLYMRWRIKAPHSRKYIAAKTVMNNWSQLRLLLKWMVSQGIASFSYTMIPYVNELLFGAAAVLVFGSGVLMGTALKNT